MATTKSGPVITTHVDLVYPTKYVKAADLRGKDVTIVIERVTWEALVMAGGKRDTKAAIHMRSTGGKPLEKLWIAGKTVLKQIAKATGEREIGNWSGKRVTMYPTTCKGGGGEEMECIRVRVRTSATAVEIPEDMAAAPLPSPDFVDEAGADAAPNADDGR
jgi:hypothetical protein